MRLRPAPHARARIEHYALDLPAEAQVRWQQDPFGNHVAHVAFPPGFRLEELRIGVELAVDARPVNPFDFFLDDGFEAFPFAYPEELAAELAPFLGGGPELASGARVEALLASLPDRAPTTDFIVAANQAVNRALRYVIRDEPGIWTPERTLDEGRGSCRDQAVLLMALLRRRGLAARFASGYLIQLADEGMLPDEPKGVSRDVVDLHAWTEVFLPGAGWIGLDPTSGLLTGEGHVPLACVARPSLAAPIEGTSDTQASEVRFTMALGRLGHEARPTAPFPDSAWEALLDGADRADAALAASGLAVTSGGEPTFNSREHLDAPEWVGEALGPTKWPAGVALATELRPALLPGAALLRRTGKWYPGEPLPRWTLELVGRADGAPVWEELPAGGAPADAAAAERFAGALAVRLGLPPDAPQPAFEDPWPIVMDEARLPVDVDPLAAGVGDGEGRRRLARLLGGDPGAPVGFALPLARSGRSGWRTERWRFRRERLYLVPGDSAMGLRLPLGALGGALPVLPEEPPLAVPDPRVPEDDSAQVRLQAAGPAPSPAVAGAVRTALCVEPRDGELFVFLPPVARADDFLALLAAVDSTRREQGIAVRLEGYPPPPSPALRRLQIAPDPGVLEVNLPPQATGRAHAAALEAAFAAALRAGLHAERYLLDGRLSGSGGGHHVTIGGPTPLESPWVRRPELLASLVTFTQHHPSLSFLFTGLFVGPTSQAPRVDEARLDTLPELEIALEGLFRAEAPPPWLGDALLRNLLTDLTGNTHRAELSIDKLWDWRTPHGRQGLVELRAFEMPPHPRLAVAQALLVRSLVAAFARAPYRAPLVRWGAELHDRFLLPHFLWRDFEEVLAFLAERGLALPPEPFRAFAELRCPVAGLIDAGGVRLEVRNALEPWNVLGEEPSGGGTSRYVDSSVERIEVRVEGMVPGRHLVSVNGLELPLRPTGTAGEGVGGVRFRAWAPPHALHPHLGIHHPLRIELVDGWAARTLAACRYHVWHPEGRAFVAPPLTRFEASARRAQRFTVEGGTPWPARPRRVEPLADMPWTLDLRRHPGDRPMPGPLEEEP